MVAGFTTVVYGPVSLFRCTTRSFAQTPVYDESGTNVQYMRTLVSVSGFLNGRMLGAQTDTGANHKYQLTKVQELNDNGQPLPIINSEGKASLRHKEIRRLLQPRQAFKMKMGDTKGDGEEGTILLEANPAPNVMIPGEDFDGELPNGPVPVGTSNIALAKVDLNNGPRCLEFNVIGVTADELYTIEATFEVCHNECKITSATDNNTFGILSNRWACHDSIDSNMRTVRTYTGSLKLASANINPHHLRAICIPPLVRMFRRESMTFAASEDGLTFNWSVTDIEIAQSAPYPARRWHVSHTISQEAKDAFMGADSVSVDLFGDTNCNKSDLIDLAIYIISAKAFGCRPQFIGQFLFDGVHTREFWNSVIIKHLEFTDDIGDDVHISARATFWSLPYTKGHQAVDDNGNVTTDVFKVAADRVAKRFGAQMVASDVATNAAKKDLRPGYDRVFSFGGYYGDKIEYEGPCISNLNIFLNYFNSPCGNGRETAPLSVGPDSARKGRITERQYGNLDDYDRNPVLFNLMDDIPTQPPPRVDIVVQAQVNPTSIAPGFMSESHKTAAYTSWQIENVYRDNESKIQLPKARRVDQYQQNVSGERPKYKGRNYMSTSSVVSMSGGQAQRILRVTGERIGQQPQFPNPNAMPNFASTYSATLRIPGSSEENQGGIHITQECLKRRIRLFNPVRTLSGPMLYRAQAEYLFALSRPLNPGEEFEMGNDMWAKTVTESSARINDDGSQTITESVLPNNRRSNDNGSLTNTDWTKPPESGNVIPIDLIT